MKRKAFTLVEILIVLVIFWMLSWIMLKTYSTISQVSFRIGQDKELAKETLILSQVLDNISQTATIDYEAYEKKGTEMGTSEYLSDNNWFVDVLFLTWDIWTWTAVYSTGNCEYSSGIYNEDYIRPTEEWAPCKLVLSRWRTDVYPLWTSETILLGDTENWSWEYIVSKIKFRVIPYDTSKNIINEFKEYAPWQPAFWAIGAIYSKFYNPKKRSTSSILPIQLFFGLKWETPSIYS